MLEEVRKIAFSRNLYNASLIGHRARFNRAPEWRFDDYRYVK